MTFVADDFHYSTTSSGKKIKYGEAGDCFSASKEYCRKGEFKIDLTGTGFRLKASFLIISNSYEKYKRKSYLKEGTFFFLICD